MKLILASSSVYRKELLSRLQLPFETQVPDIDETPNANETPTTLVERLAIEKAKVIAAHEENALVIGSDQVAVHDGVIVGKPKG
jgi:septum formation protein